MANKSTKGNQSFNSIQLDDTRFRAFMDHAPDSYFLFNLSDGKIVDVNKMACENLGYTRKELLSKFIWEIDPDIKNKNYKESFRNKLEDKNKIITFEGKNFKKDGSSFPVEIRISLFEVGNEQFILASSRDISERKISEEVLLQTQFSVEKARDAVFWIDSEGNLEYVNEAACKSLGYSKEELLKLTVFDIDPYFPKSNWPEHRKKLHKLKSYQIETYHKTKSGKIFPVEVAINIMSFKGKEYSNTFVRDISERKKAEEKLKNSEERFRLALSAANQGIYDLNVQTGDTKVTPEYATMLGYNPEEFQETNEKWLKRLHPDDLEKTKEKYDKYIEGKSETYSVEFRQFTKSGSWKWILSRGKIVEWDDYGKPLRMLGIHTDLTAQKQVEDELRLSQFVIENAATGIFFITDKARFFYANKKACESLGYSQEELCKLSVYDIDPDFIPGNFQKLWEKIKSKGSIMIENVHKRKDGTRFPVEVNANYLEYKGEQYSISFIRDITDRKEAEQTIKLSEKKYRYVFDFAPLGIYHSLRNGTIILANQKFAEILGYETVQDVMKINIKDIYVDTGQRDFLIKENESKGYGLHRTMKWKKKNGSKIFIQLNAHAVKDESGNTIYFEGFVYDVTDEKIANEKVQQEVKKTKTLVKIAAELNSTLNIHDVLSTICNQTNEALNVSSVYIFFYKKSLNKFEYETGNGFSNKDSELLPLISKLIFDEIITNNNKIFSFKDIFGLIKTARREKLNIKRFAAASLFYNEELIGAIGISAGNEDRDFTSDDLDLLQGISHQAALAIHNSRLLSKHTRAEYALRENEKLLNESQKIAHLGHYALEVKKGIWKSSETLNEVFGIEKDYVKNINGWLNIVHPDDKEMMNDYFVNSVVRNKEPFDKEYRIIRINDKTTRWVHGIGKLNFDDEGNVIQMMGTIQDITERKKSETELKLSEARLSEAQKIAHIGNWNWDLQEDDLYWSEETYRICGIDPDRNVSFELYASLIHPDDKEFVKEKINDSILNKKTYSNDHRILLPDGTVKYVHVEGKITYDKKDNPIRMFGTIQDISESKKFEEELISAKNKAEEMSRLKSNFLANMSHELRTPLFGIIGFSELLTHEITDPVHKEMIDAVYESSKRLSETLNLILDLSKIETDKVDYKPVTFDIVASSFEIVNNFNEVAKKKKIYLNTHYEQPKLKVQLDKRAFESILNNLVNNAIKFTRSGGVEVFISSEIIERKKYIIIKVKDTGIGIAKENFNLIFDEFRQASEGLDRNFEGSGLGLNITKKFVEKLNGTISLESEINKGSTFTVILPLIHGTETKTQSVKSSSTVKKSLQLDFVPDILLVDDDINVKSILSNYLSPSVNLVHVFNADDAIKKVNEQKFDLILMDINLKGETDGIKATQEIRKNPEYEKTPIVACTAYAMSGDKEEFLSKGCSHYISKPFSKNEIILLLREIFSKEKYKK